MKWLLNQINNVLPEPLFLKFQLKMKHHLKKIAMFSL